MKGNFLDGCWTSPHSILSIRHYQYLSSNHREVTYVIPGAGTVRVGALVASEIIDHDTAVAMIVEWAGTAAAWARCRRWTVVLSYILQLAVL